MRVARVLTLGGLAGALACARPACEGAPSGGRTATGTLGSSKDARAAIVGAWRLVSIIDSLPDGRTASWMGEHPQGILVYDAAGYMSAQLMAPARPRFPGHGPPLRDAVSDSTVRAAFAGYYAYFGRYEIFPDSQLVVHHVQGSLWPAEVGLRRRRVYRLAGNRLSLRALPERDGVRYPRWLTWERVP